jgi:hypothetical protein
MMKKIIIYHLLLFFVILLFACAPRLHVAPNPVEKDNKFVEQILRNIITRGMDF